MSKSDKRAARLKRLYEKHGWKIQIPASALPSEDKASLGGGLRCFKPTYMRDDNGNKLRHVPKKRCGHPAIKGSLFCKRHGGNNTNALVKGTSSPTNSMYRLSFSSDLGELFNAFINDPSVNDLRPELSALRTCLNTYLGELTRHKPIKNPKKLNKRIRDILNNEELTEDKRFASIKTICAREQYITDEDALIRITNLCETISRIVERMNKITSKDEYILTPDGLKILFRAIIETLRNILDEEQLKTVKAELMTISVRTKGDLTLYGTSKDLQVFPKIVDGKVENGQT